ncbi:MAG: FG-GAP repeat domain-containing protein, partial [Gemmataceae bacterium]
MAGIKSSRPDVPSLQPAARKRRTPARIALPDSGNSLAYTVASRTSHDPTSLESIRAAFQDLGSRGIATRRLQSAPSPRHKLDQLLQIALLYGYEGDFVKAGATLDAARSLAEDNPFSFVAELPTVIFLQGLMALRRGEVENCVDCPCQGSCIFPLQSNAVHQKREGSRQAVKYFREYLEGRPDDLGVRWLLNVAYMTLGEYPNGVPEPLRLPLEPFRSEFDMGRFVDVAPTLGLNRLHCAGGAIMDDFDNDGLLDVIESSWDAAEPLAFYRNQGDGTFTNRAK